MTAPSARVWRISALRARRGAAARKDGDLLLRELDPQGIHAVASVRTDPQQPASAHADLASVLGNFADLTIRAHIERHAIAHAWPGARSSAGWRSWLHARTVSPRGRADQRAYVIAENAVETERQARTGVPPSVYVGKSNTIRRQLRGIEVLVSDGISPCIQVLERRAPSGVARVVGIDAVPEVQTEPPEVRADISRVRISSVEKAALE